MLTVARACALTCLSVWLWGRAGNAQEWPRFRGPDGGGVSETATVPSQWTEKDYRWKVDLPGMGYSSPVVWGDRVLVTSAMEKEATLVVLCFRTSDGGQLWRRDFALKPYRKHQFNGYAAATPALDEHAAYVTWATPDHYVVAALALQDGSEAWRRDLGPFVSQHGFGASPILWNELLIVPNDQDGPGLVTALDRKTGKTRWQVRRRGEKASFSTPFVLQPEEGRPQLIFSSWAHGITSLDPQSGELNWELPDFRNRVVGSPMTAAGLIFAAAGVGGIGREMVVVQPGESAGGAEAKLLYRGEGPLPYVPTPVAKGKLVFLWQDRGVVTCLDAPTGNVHWRERISGDYFGSPVRVGDRLYCVSRTGEMVVLAAAEKFKLLARFPLGEPSHSTPAIAGGAMYLRTVSHLMAIGGNGAP